MAKVTIYDSMKLHNVSFSFYINTTVRATTMQPHTRSSGGRQAGRRGAPATRPACLEGGRSAGRCHPLHRTHRALSPCAPPGAGVLPHTAIYGAAPSYASWSARRARLHAAGQV